MDSKTIFLEACNKIAAQLNGFEIYKKGQRLKKNSLEKDIFFEITFETSYMNASSHVMMTPNIAVYSKVLKKWQREHLKNEFCSGLIYGSHLGYITPHQTWKKWNLAGLNFGKSVNEIVKNLQKYVLPIFELFNSKEDAIEFLKKRGTNFNQYAEDSLGPIDFLLCCSNKETAEVFFNNYIKNSDSKSKIIKFYENLKTEDEIDLNHSEFYSAGHIKLAYVNKLEITR